MAPALRRAKRLRKGAVHVFVAISMTFIIGFAALAVDLSALGEVDTASANDACPRPPNGSDPGCGNKTSSGALGADVFTDVAVKP